MSNRDVQAIIHNSYLWVSDGIVAFLQIWILGNFLTSKLHLLIDRHVYASMDLFPCFIWELNEGFRNRGVVIDFQGPHINPWDFFFYYLLVAPGGVSVHLPGGQIKSFLGRYFFSLPLSWYQTLEGLEELTWRPSSALNPATCIASRTRKNKCCHTMAQPYQGFWWAMGQPMVLGVSGGY